MFRVPRKSIFKKVQAVLPQLPNGDVEVVLTASPEELQRIQNDMTWRRWAEWICS